jgi:hypothetical protein
VLLALCSSRMHAPNVAAALAVAADNESSLRGCDSRICKSCGLGGQVLAPLELTCG